MPSPNPLPLPKPLPIPNPPTTNKKSCSPAGVAEKKGKKKEKPDAKPTPKPPKCSDGSNGKRVKLGSKWVYEFTDWVDKGSPEQNIPEHNGPGNQYWMWRGGHEKDIPADKRQLYLLNKAANFFAGLPEPCVYRYYLRRVKYECRCPDGTKC